MIEFYPQIRNLHIAMVLISGALFALRGAGSLAGGRWPMAWPVRWSTYAIDTTLLTAALMLLTMLPWAVFANGWLAMKVGLLVVYIALGAMALGQGRPARVRAALYVSALLVYAWMISIARAHHPLGIFRPLLD
jgi:uncharacterized membrane protein SirB2